MKNDYLVLLNQLDGNLAGIDSHYFDVFEKPSDICVVDLDTGYINM